MKKEVKILPWTQVSTHYVIKLFLSECIYKM